MNIHFEGDTIVRRKIGKKYLQMRMSHKLPFYYSEFLFYDRALPRICKDINQIDGYLMVVDIGANIGDSVSLITDEVQGSFLCIEGNKEYLPFLKANTRDLKESKIVIEESYCSEDDINNKNYKVEKINGTAKIVSTSENSFMPHLEFNTLNSIIKRHSSFDKVNVVKIDVDGFEINVLNGGEEFLQDMTPVLYFEFSPELYLNHNQDPLYIFEFLNSNGYDKVLMYDNFGMPVEIINTSDKTKIKALLNLIDNKKIYYYDILTFHHSKMDKYDVLIEDELLSHTSLVHQELNLAKSQLNLAKSQLNLVRMKLDGIYLSRTW